ncbi:hypothetical protein CYY_002912 [Polysphondylium violaceum]|uniref:UBC core domain-containing protein n=1 Tax=Polysphondylium violaceum TaxID=133409 RepID=A0A8J4V969_9MYCE|nr:hypothetical protein CYY_002912 [Polysphondylium violaceum]
MAGNLERVFEKWQTSQADPYEFVWLQSTKNSIDLLFKGHEITITFPLDINNIDEFVFSCREKTVNNWIVELNKEIKQSPPSDFNDVLSLAVKIYQRKKIKLSNEKDDSETQEGEEEEDEDDSNVDEDEEDEEDDYGDDDDDDHHDDEGFQEALQSLKLKKIWAQKDLEIRSQLGEKKKVLKVKSIFSSDAAFSILTNDLFKIMQNTQEFGFSAEPLDDNIYFWKVKLFGFDKESKIYSHLQEIQREYGYDYIEIHVMFTPDLYPFYPPTVRVIRPRLQGFLLGRISHIEILELENWNPINDMKFVLDHLKQMIQTHGLLDVNNPMNALTYNKGSYSSLEHLLLRLEILSNIAPRANLKYGIPSTFVKLKGDNKVKEGDSQAWAKGTGYGRGSDTKGWNVNAFLAAQKERDEEIVALIKSIENEVRNASIPFDVLEESCLVPFFDSYYRDVSLLDIERHVELWDALMKLTDSLLDMENYLPLFAHLEFQDKSLSDLFKDLSFQCNLILKQIDTKEKQEGYGQIVDIYQKIDRVGKKMESKLQILKEEIKKLDDMRKKTQTTSISSTDCQAMYLSKLRPLIFDTYTSTKAEAKGMPSQQSRTLRIAQEQSSLIKSLPLTFDSSVFVRVHEQNIDIMKVLITGPSDTPYSAGCFVFKVTFPANYPFAPPSVILETTGHGSVRFNPNLYNNGKVCLSLLGTWSGGAGETWNPSTSTLLQVLVSIQSLILVPEPYFNEPGYESQMSTPTGKASSKKYTEGIRESMVEWAMIDMMKNPPKEFEDVVKLHFFYQKDKIKAQLNKWVDENSSSSKLLKLLSRVQTEMDSIKL